MTKDTRDKQSNITEFENNDETRLGSYLFNNAPDALCMLDQDGRFIIANQRFCDIVSFSPQSLKGMALADILFESNKSQALKNFNKLLNGEEINVSTVKVKNSTGKTVYLDLRSVVFESEGRRKCLFFSVNKSSENELLNRLEWISKISLEVSSIKPLEEVLRTIARNMVEHTDVDHATVTLFNNEHQFFEIKVEWPEINSNQLVGEKIFIEDRPSQKAMLRSQRPIIAANLLRHKLLKESEEFAKVVSQLQIKSLLIVPMVIEGDVIGTISVDSIKRARNYSRHDVKIYQIIASQAAIAIKNAKIYDEERAMRAKAEMLENIQYEINENFGLKEIASRSLDKLQRLVDFRSASIQLIVKNQRVLLAGLGFNSENIDPRLIRPIDKDSLIQEILLEQHLKIISNTNQSSSWEKQPSTSTVNSWICIPLIARGRPIALLTLDHDVPDYYDCLSDLEIEAIEQFAARTAISLYNAQLYDAAKQQIKSLSLINKVATIVSANLEPKGIFNEILKLIKGEISCSSCSIVIYESEEVTKKLLRQDANSYQTGKIVVTLSDSNFQDEADDNFIWEALNSGEAILANSSKKETVQLNSAEIISKLLVPIKSSNNTIGVISLTRGYGREFSKTEQILIETLTPYISFAVDRNTGLHLLQDINSEIIKATTIEETLKEIVLGAIRLTRVSSGVIYLFNEEKNRVISKFHPPGDTHYEPRLKKKRGITRQVIDSKQMIVISNIKEDRRVNPKLYDTYKSMIAVPLILDNAVVGVLYLNGTRASQYTETEKSLLLTLASQASIAVEKAKLLQTLKDSEAEYHSLIDSLPQGVFRKDVNSRFTSVNASFCESIGLNQSEIIGKDDFFFYPAHLAEKYVQDDKIVMLSKRKLENDEEYRQKNPDKTIFVHTVKVPVLNSRDVVTGVQGIFWDITQEKLMKERYESLAEHSPDSIVVHEGGKITLANQAALKLLGFTSKKELQEHSILDFVHPDDRPKAEKRLEMMLKKESVEKMVEMKILRSDGSVVDAEVYAHHAPGDKEIQVVFHDLRRVNTLLSEMHHRVSKILNQVKLHLKEEQSYADSPEIKQALVSINNRIQAMAKVHEILNQTTGETVNMRDYIIPLKDAVFKAYDVPPELIKCKINISNISLDSKRAIACGLIVNELLTNSLLHAFKDKMGSIAIKLLKKSTNLYSLVVSDNGSGMLEEAIESRGLSLVSRLITDELEGRVNRINDKGLHWEIKFPRFLNGESLKNG